MTSATNLETRVAAGVEYHVGGEGEPLLLVHGLGGSAENWVEVIPELVKRHRVVAVDLPGHAGSRPLHAGPGWTTLPPRRPECSTPKG